MADFFEGFDPLDFRSNIHSVMQLGLPQNKADRPTFYFRETKSFPPGTVLDSEGTPLDPRISATVSSPTPVQVPCAVEFTATGSDGETIVGTFRETRAKLTLLDVDYAKIQDAIEVALGQVRYNIAYQEAPIGLGTVTVHQLHVFPKNENR